jgi:hypothetical protein
VKVDVSADAAKCGSLFDPVGIRQFSEPCDLARRVMSQQAIKYTYTPGAAGAPLKVSVNGADVAWGAGAADFTKNIAAAATAAGYPAAGRRREGEGLRPVRRPRRCRRR